VKKRLVTPTAFGHVAAPLNSYAIAANAPT